ncbi:hypothetical protein CEH05_17105 [Halobacillus halophilus]|uniref:Uncharacterized protein n=1 Tax=Halobacillus halophilus (strain ATCC 35676 / DSM 2266 / JCM 20832 / KCTC 3685 / LMG 17431 / NBRC 102448 / NCIMB 2269) TaxID=866895 RepID=I0JRP4_HALH3|nr:hypothetical protein [Halobacillus halophilus]ASF40779.1 hypothetical protein CEH05_17105 [Halobacillus halophilus]CCG46815.1 hypothetical protein HBHAL_4475 [Halobacillus halophilus DSM 2266]
MRRFFIELSAILLIYAAGSLLDLSWLQFYYSNEYSPEDGKSIHVGGSILPIILGIVVYFIAAKMILKKSNT